MIRKPGSKALLDIFALASFMDAGGLNMARWIRRYEGKEGEKKLGWIKNYEVC